MISPHDIPLQFAFDPTYGYDRDALLRVPAPDTEPDDFAAFWQDVHERALKVPLQLEERSDDAIGSGLRCKIVFFDILGDFRPGAWVIYPEDLSEVRYGVVCGHGYGGRGDGPEPGLARPDRVLIFPLAPGFQMSAAPDRVGTNDCSQHVVCGIESKETYILGPCAAQIWRSIDVLEALFPSLNLQFHYRGWSFGGGMGALMLPWEKRFQSAELGQVTFGNHPIRLRCKCQGSGEAVRHYHAEHPEVEEVLAYFDTATSAKYFEVPVVFALSMFDPAVPPPGQFSVANAATCPKRISCFSVGHVDWEPPTAQAEANAHQHNLRELLGPFAE